MAIKTCDHCKEEILIGTAVVVDGKQAHFYCLRQSCQQVFRAQTRNERDRLYAEGRLCRFKPLVRPDPCGCEGIAAVENGMCAAHAALRCSYPGCTASAVTECVQAMGFKCKRPVCLTHRACCDEHAAETDPPRIRPS